jgi:hypothetical protein
MEDKKLTAIISAIIAYLQTEQKPIGGTFPKEGSK